MNEDLFVKVDNYIRNLFAPQDDELQATEQSIDEAHMPKISVSPNQGKLLHILALLCNARKILEIGTLGGYSTIWIARALPKDGSLITIERNPKHASVAQRNITRAGLESNVDIRVGKALELLPGLEAEGAGPFDMIFIDADKPSYPQYFEWALKFSRPGALIVADNVIRDGKVILSNSSDEKVSGVQRFNAMLAENSVVTSTILQTVGVKGYDGMALAFVNRGATTADESA
jgi:caffeoyl-CoA O-methyltransferase